MKFRKLASLVLGIVMAASLLTGCGGEEQKEKTDAPQTPPASEQNDASNDTEGQLKGEIVFGTNRTDKADSTIRELADEFQKLHTGVKVEVEAYKDPDSVIPTRAAANELPDVTLVPVKFSRKDLPLYFAPLDDLGFTKDNIYFYENGVSEDGKLYALDSAVNVNGIAYNKKAFEQAGIQEVPTTMEAFYEACEKLKKAGIIPYGSNFKDAWPLQTYFYDLPNMIEGDASYRDKLAQKGSKFLEADKGMLEAWDFIRTMNEKGFLEPDLMSTNWDSFKKEMAVGEVAMTMLGSWFPPQLVENGAKAEDIGMFPHPMAESILLSGDWRFAVAKNAESLETAKAFLKFLWEDSRYQKAVGVASPLKDAKYDAPWLAEIFSYDTPRIEAKADSTRYSAVYNAAQIDHNAAIQEYILADSPQEVIDNLNRKWQNAQDKAK